MPITISAKGLDVSQVLSEYAGLGQAVPEAAAGRVALPMEVSNEWPPQ